MDIVERLRDRFVGWRENFDRDLKNEAADEIERLREQLKMSEQRFATLKEAYDKNRRRNIQLYGSKALGEKE
jgi:hypothetical protein